MTSERLECLEKYFLEILQEVKRARQSERIAKAAAQIYRKRLEPFKLVKREAA